MLLLLLLVVGQLIERLATVGDSYFSIRFLSQAANNVTVRYQQDILWLMLLKW